MNITRFSKSNRAPSQPFCSCFSNCNVITIWYGYINDFRQFDQICHGVQIRGYMMWCPWVYCPLQGTNSHTLIIHTLIIQFLAFSLFEHGEEGIDLAEVKPMFAAPSSLLGSSGCGSAVVRWRMRLRWWSNRWFQLWVDSWCLGSLDLHVWVANLVDIPLFWSIWLFISNLRAAAAPRPVQFLPTAATLNAAPSTAVLASPPWLRFFCVSSLRIIAYTLLRLGKGLIARIFRPYHTELSRVQSHQELKNFLCFLMFAEVVFFLAQLQVSTCR